MFRLVAIRLEVQIVSDDMVLIRVECDLHVEFTPSFLGDSEWGVLESCTSPLILASLVGREEMTDSQQHGKDMPTKSIRQMLTKGPSHTLNSSIAETRVQSICDLVKHIRWDLLSMLVQEVNLNGPGTERKPLHTGILVAAIQAVSTLQLNRVCM